MDDADIAISYRADIIAVPSSRWDGIIASRDIKNGNCTTASGVCYSADIIPTRTKNGEFFRDPWPLFGWRDQFSRALSTDAPQLTGTWHEGSDISTAVYTFIGNAK